MNFKNSQQGDDFRYSQKKSSKHKKLTQKLVRWDRQQTATHTYTGCGLDFFRSRSRGGMGSRDEPMCPAVGGVFCGCRSDAVAEDDDEELEL